MLPIPAGNITDISVKATVMANRYRESQPAINKPSQDTLPNRD